MWGEPNFGRAEHDGWWGQVTFCCLHDFGESSLDFRNQGTSAELWGNDRGYFGFSENWWELSMRTETFGAALELSLPPV
jgi:hypothetical protein